MRVVSWNVNGIRACAGKGLFGYLASDSPDVLCLQETKAHPEQLDPAWLEPRDGEGRPYRSFFSSAERKGYSGTAIYSRLEPDAFETLGDARFDAEGRVSIARFGKLKVVSAYFPNSQEAGARLGYKLDFCAAMMDLCRSTVSAGGSLVLCGDFNIAHKPIDLANPEANEGNPGYLPEERAWMDEFTAAGFVDSYRALNPDKAGAYTWWTYRVPSARVNNVGWRLDYHCVDSEFSGALAEAGIQAQVLGSDHCPVSLFLDLPRRS